MHQDVIFPGFSAFHTTGAVAPAAPGGAAEAQAAAGTGRPGPAGTGPARVYTPPFSWLGGDAWPDFPRRADRQP
jgi:hypothetical protein